MPAEVAPPFPYAECPDCGTLYKRTEEVQFKLQHKCGEDFGVSGENVVRGGEFVARAASGNMARRIANALNRYTPGPRGF